MKKPVDEGILSTITNVALMSKLMKDVKPSFWTTVLLLLQANKVKGRASMGRGMMKAAALARMTKRGFGRRTFKERVLDRLVQILAEADHPAVVRKWAKDLGVPVKEVQRRYDKAATLASKKFEPETERWWKYKMGIFKQMMYKYPGQNRGGRGTKAIKRAARGA